MAAGAEHLSRDFILLEFRSLPGKAHDGALQERPRQDRTAAHHQWFRPGGGAHPGGDPGKLPERRRHGDDSAGAGAVYGRRDRTESNAVAACGPHWYWSPKAKPSGTGRGASRVTPNGAWCPKLGPRPRGGGAGSARENSD